MPNYVKLHPEVMAFLKANGSCVDDGGEIRYYHFPYWIKQDDLYRTTELLSFEKIPSHLKNLVWEKRGEQPPKDHTFEIAVKSRRMGNTEYLIQAAIRNPNVVIICSNDSYARDLEKRYLQTVDKRSWWRKVLDKLTGRGKKRPEFIGLVNSGDRLRGLNVPVVFDLSALLR